MKLFGYLCKEMEHSNPNWEYHRISSITISKRYNINIEGLKLWMTNCNQDFNCFSKNEQCCQPLFDGRSKKRIANLYEADQTSTLELIDFMNHELIKTKRRRSTKAHGRYIRIKAPHCGC